MHTTSATIQTAFTQLMGIRHPVVLAPMAGVSGGLLAAEVSRAGGLGLIGGGYGDATFLEQQFALAAEQPVGVGFITWSLAQQPQLLQQALSYKPVAVMLSFGELEPFAAQIKNSGAVLIAQVQNLQQALSAVHSGADVLVAQGSEAGGHGAARATLPLVPAVVDALANTPVLAAGGIADGRGLAASLMLGASGALMGSRFYACNESLAPEEAKTAATHANGDDTIRSKVFDALRALDWPAPFNLRSVTNRSTERWHGNMQALHQQMPSARAEFQQAVDERNYKIAPVIVGECADLISDVKPASDIVCHCVDQAIKCLQEPSHFSLS